MTYYGRWTCKFEEAARRGAAGAKLAGETTFPNWNSDSEFRAARDRSRAAP